MITTSTLKQDRNQLQRNTIQEELWATVQVSGTGQSVYVDKKKTSENMTVSVRPMPAHRLKGFCLTVLGSCGPVR